MPSVAMSVGALIVTIMQIAQLGFSFYGLGQIVLGIFWVS